MDPPEVKPREDMNLSDEMSNGKKEERTKKREAIKDCRSGKRNTTTAILQT